MFGYAPGITGIGRVEDSSLLLLFQLKRPGVERIILPFLRDEIIMAAALNDVAMVQYKNDIGVFHSRQAVGYDKYRSALH